MNVNDAVANATEDVDALHEAVSMAVCLAVWDAVFMGGLDVGNCTVNRPIRDAMNLEVMNERD